jgi:hypothetical protein
MKKILLLFTLLSAYASLAMDNAQKSSHVPAVHPPSIPFRDIKTAVLGIYIYANERRDEELWNKMVAQFSQLEHEKFNQKALLHAIIDEIDLSEEKTGNGVWGGLSFTYMKDSQKLDQQKS